MTAAFAGSALGDSLALRLPGQCWGRPSPPQPAPPRPRATPTAAPYHFGIDQGPVVLMIQKTGRAYCGTYSLLSRRRYRIAAGGIQWRLALAEAVSTLPDVLWSVGVEYTL